MPLVKSRRPQRHGRTGRPEHAMLWSTRRRPCDFMTANHPQKPDKPTDGQETGRALRFEPRPGGRRPRPSPPLLGRSPVEGVDKYARQPDEPEDYRHRMRVNAAAI